MSESLPLKEPQFDPWELGISLQVEADKIARFIEHRDPTSASTTSKILTDVVVPLTETHKNTEVFVQSMNAMVPLPEGVGIGLSESHGQIVGFGYGEFSADGMTYRPQHGLITFVAIDVFNGESANDLPHRLNVLPPGIPSADIVGAVIGVPVVRGTKIAKIQEGFQIPDSIEDIVYEANAEDFKHMDFVQSINAITGQVAIVHPSIDKTKLDSAFNILSAMNQRCPYMGKSVEVTSSHMRVKHPLKDTHLVIKGTVDGVIRKFIIASYQDLDTKDFRSDVQAVIYEPSVAEKVYSGELTPQQADKQPTTVFVPLSIPHVIKVLS